MFSNVSMLLGGIVLYILLLFWTSYLMHRQVTTELLLIIGWGMLVFCEMNTLYGSHAFTSAAAIIGCVVAAIFVITSMVCYLAYYDLEPMKGFYDGMIPLILVGIYMICDEHGELTKINRLLGW